MDIENLLNYKFEVLKEVTLYNGAVVDLISAYFTEFDMPFGFYKNKDGSLYIIEGMLNPERCKTIKNFIAKDIKIELDAYQSTMMFVQFDKRHICYSVRLNPDFSINELYISTSDKKDSYGRKIALILNNNLPSMEVNIADHCIYLNAKIDSDSNINEISLIYSELQANYSKDNIYAGIITDHHKDKKWEDLGIAQIKVFQGRDIIDADSQLYVLGNEIGFKKDHKIDYTNTIKNVFSKNCVNIKDILSMAND